MSKNRNRALFNKAINGKHYKNLIIKFHYPLYWNESIKYRGNWTLYPHQWRKFRTWKHNRKKQWKLN